MSPVQEAGRSAASSKGPALGVERSQAADSDMPEWDPGSMWDPGQTQNLCKPQFPHQVVGTDVRGYVTSGPWQGLIKQYQPRRICLLLTSTKQPTV